MRFLSFKAGGTKCVASVGRLFWLWLCPLALGHWGTGALAGLAGCLVGWVPRQDWCGRVWNQRDFSCRLAQQQRRRRVESESESEGEVEIEGVTDQERQRVARYKEKSEAWVS